MISGTVVGLQPRISLILRLPDQSNTEVEFVVDTGFEGFLTLPPDTVAEFELTYVARIDANLADNSTIAANACFITNLWNGVERDIVALELGSRPLIGTGLLEDCHLSIDFCDGGTVLVDEIL